MEIVCAEFPADSQNSQYLNGWMSCSSLAEAEILLLTEIHPVFTEVEMVLGASSLWKCVHNEDERSMHEAVGPKPMQSTPVLL